jgi:hypothetical protein
LRLETLETRLCLSTWSDPVNLGPIINDATATSRPRPAISSDDLSLYFSSDRPGGSDKEGLWVSHRASVDDPWREPQNLGPTLNTGGTESAPNLSRDQHWLFFHSNRSNLGEGYGGLDIYASYRQDTHDDLGWQYPINLGPGVNTHYDDAGPCYFEDPATGITSLYFDTNRPGGLGDIDINASTLQGFASFGPAVLVPELSSPNRDTRPAIRRDGLEMFLTSTRPGGLGSGLNIWVSTRASTLDPWSTPVNLGTPINMDGFDDGSPALSSDGNTLYFFSNRPGGFGVYDLYMSTRLDGGQAPPRAPARKFLGVDPGIVLILGSFSSLADRATFGNLHVNTAEPVNSVPPLQAPEIQVTVLYPAASSPVSNSPERQATERFFTVRAGADQSREPLAWATASELDLLASSPLG